MNEIDQEEFLSRFKAGEYIQLTVLVKTKDFPKFIKAAELSGVDLAIMPNVNKEELELLSKETGDAQ